MLPWFAHLLVPVSDPHAMATSYAASEVGAELLAVTDEAAGRGSIADWEGRQLSGTGFVFDIVRRAGVSMEPAVLCGVGHFWGDWPENFGPTVRAASEAGRRAVEAMARATRDGFSFEVAPVFDHLSDLPYGFQEAWRRRIAYFLGYQASIAEGSLECHDVLYRAAIAGPVSALYGVARSDELRRFSLLLNFASRLHGSVAYERAHGAPHAAAGGRVTHYADKGKYLDDELARLRGALARGFNEDGRAALAANVAVMQRERERGIWNVEEGPVWGRDGGSGLYVGATAIEPGGAATGGARRAPAGRRSRRASRRARRPAPRGTAAPAR